MRICFGVVLDGFVVVTNFVVDSFVDTDGEESFAGDCVVVRGGSGLRVVVVVLAVVSISFSVVDGELVTVVAASVAFSGMLRSVVPMSFNDESILSALASIISRPARIKSKKLFSVVGSALNG